MYNILLPVLLIVFLAGNMFFIISRHKPQTTLREYSVAGCSAGTATFLFSFVGRWIPGAVCTVWFTLAAERGVYAHYLILYSLGAVAMLRCFGIPIWRLSQQYGLETQADFIELRYGSKLFKSAFSALTLLFWFPWVILELKTIGQAIAATSGNSIEYNIGIISVTMFIIIFCFYGGVRSVNNSAVLQTVILILFGCICAYCLICRTFGGVFNLYADVAVQAPALLHLDFSSARRFEWLSAIISGTLGSIFWPGMFCLIYAADSTKSIRRASVLAPLLLLPFFWLLLSLGSGAQLIPGFEAEGSTGLFWIAEQYGDPFLRAMLGVGAVAASMSMCAPVFNVAGIMVAKDLYATLRLRSGVNTLKAARISTVLVGLVALWLATLYLPNLVSLVMLMYNFIIQASAPILLGLCWRRSTLGGAASGMVFGIVTTLLMSLCPSLVDFVSGWSAGMMGLAVNVTVHVIVSLLMPKNQVFHR
ncbi:MAG: sodium:solute symporter family protein [Clostridiales Family XIII bacterium]|jgi:SSS family solute:Na+ symporter|nr:sodium:solute symporter family protein [Clostridiales Family XIII bacterium]